MTPEFLLPVPAVDHHLVEVHTLRFGAPGWLADCAPTLEAWVERCGYSLRIWDHPGDGYPDPKFAVIDMLRNFLNGDSEWMAYVDADVVFHPLAPRFDFLSEPGFYAMKDPPSEWSAGFPEWAATEAGVDVRAWRYRNAGIWICDRAAAKKILDVERPPYRVRCQEQCQFNLWLWEAGIEVLELPSNWNRMPPSKAPAWAFHLAGKGKVRRLQALQTARLLPQWARPFDLLAETTLERAICIPWHPSEGAFDELRFCLRSVLEHFRDDCPIYILSECLPDWLNAGGRIRWRRCSTYQHALSTGVQLAAQVLWMNDDMALLRDCGWEDFETPRHGRAIPAAERELMWWSNNPWFQGVGRALIDLAHRGKGQLDLETHAPYVWRREKALEILRVYGPWRKMPMQTLYANHHEIPGVPLEDGFRSHDPSANALFLSYDDSRATPEFRAELAGRFKKQAPWEH